MSVDHAKWLQQQGVRIIDQHTLRQAHQTPYVSWGDPNELVDWRDQHMTFTTEKVYRVDLTEGQIERFERAQSDIANAFDYAHRHSQGQPVRGYSGPGANDVTDFLIENRERHFKLLKENSMYKDAWQEFQSIRVLIGETPHWP